jgi:hypothetical protein
MADEQQIPSNWKVTVNKWFQYQDVIFRPAEVDGPKKGFPRYTVPHAIYSGTIDDGTPFKDLCMTADPIFERPA